MLTVEEIENISFRRSGIGGYKVEDVDTFVDGVIEKVRQQERTNQELEARIEQLNRQIIEHEAKAQLAKPKPNQRSCFLLPNSEHEPF